MKIKIEALMKKQIVRKMLSIAVTGCALLGWWGALYPQFTLLSGTYAIVDETAGAEGAEAEARADAKRNAQGAAQESADDAAKRVMTSNAQEVFGNVSGRTDDTETIIDKSALYWEILNADRSHIRVKSRLLEDWRALKRAGSERYESREE